jgi:hypothetical protein
VDSIPRAHAASGLATPACDRAHGVDGLLVAALGAQIARGAFGNVQAYGDRARVEEVVQADAAHKAPCVGKGSRTDKPVKKSAF